MITVIRAGSFIDGQERTFLDKWTNLFPLYFNKNVDYYLGIDQSTSRCGIFLRSEDWEEGMQVEFPRNSLDSIEYELQLEEFLKKLTEGLNITEVAMEKPISYGHHSANAPLAAFRKVVKGILRRLFPNIKPVEIHPSTWKSKMGINTARLNKEYKEKSISNKKQKIAEAIVQKYPKTKIMYMLSTSDYDSFDAVGILETHILMKKGNKINNKLTLKVMLVAILTTSENHIKLLQSLPDRITNNWELRKADANLTLYEIAKRSNPDKPTLVQVDSEELRVSLMWALGEEIPVGEDPLLLTIPKSYLKGDDMYKLELRFPVIEFV